MTHTALFEGDRPMPEESRRTCAGTSATGEPCRAPEDLLQVDPEDSESFYCFAHAPWLEAERALAQRKGGLRTASKHRRFRYLAPDHLGTLETPADAKRWSELIARAVSTGELASNAGNVALRAVSAWLQAHEVVELTEEVAQMREVVSRIEAREREAKLQERYRHTS